MTSWILSFKHTRGNWTNITLTEVYFIFMYLQEYKPACLWWHSQKETLLQFFPNCTRKMELSTHFWKLVYKQKTLQRVKLPAQFSCKCIFKCIQEGNLKSLFLATLLSFLLKSSIIKVWKHIECEYRNMFVMRDTCTYHCKYLAFSLFKLLLLCVDLLHMSIMSIKLLRFIEEVRLR